MSGHEKVQCSLLKLKHSESKFRKQGGGWREEGGGKMKFAAFSLFKCDCFTMLQKELGALTEPPQGSVRNEGNAVKLCRTGKLRVTSACWVIWILSVNMFCFIFPGQERRGGGVQHKG